MSVLSELKQSIIWPAYTIIDLKNNTLDMVRSEPPYENLKNIPLHLRSKAKKIYDELWEPLSPFDRASPIWSAAIFVTTLLVSQMLGTTLTPEHRLFTIAALYAAGAISELSPVHRIGQLITGGGFHQVKVGIGGVIVGLAII